jgi:hypothetical protein
VASGCIDVREQSLALAQPRPALESMSVGAGPAGQTGQTSRYPSLAVCGRQDRQNVDAT